MAATDELGHQFRKHKRGYGAFNIVTVWPGYHEGFPNSYNSDDVEGDYVGGMDSSGGDSDGGDGGDGGY